VDDHPQGAPGDRPSGADPRAGADRRDPGATTSVRVAVPDDAATLHALSLRAIRGSASGHCTGPQLEAWAARRSVAGHRRMIEETQTFVAARDGVVQGFASLAAPVFERLGFRRVVVEAVDVGDQTLTSTLMRRDLGPA
jgi:hypothetical protein